MGLNLNANINGAKRGLPYPTAGLDVIVYNSTYEDGGTTYLRTSKGIGIPKVSGTGLDTIWDFSVLNDVRLDKSNATYWGSSLNAYFYYDALNPYHYKLKDFHYFYIEKQMTGLDSYNTMFLKAIATDNVNNVIEEVFQLNIYASSKISDIVQLKKWMNIIDYKYQLLFAENYSNEATYNSVLKSWEIPDNIDKENYALQCNGINTLVTVEDSDILDVNNNVINYSFENYTGTKDSGNNAIFDNWINVNEGTGTHLAQTGVNSNIELKLVNNSSIAEIYQLINVEPETEYAVHFKYLCNVLGRYAIYDETNESDIVALTNVKEVATTIYSTQSVLITTPANCTTIKLRLVVSTTNLSYFILDEVNVMQPYDLSIAFDLRRRYETTNDDRDYFISRLYAPNSSAIDERLFSIRSIGDDGIEDDRGKIRFSFSKNLNSSAGGVYSVTKPVTDRWYNVVCTAKYNGSGLTTAKIYINGILDNTEANIEHYLINSFAPLTIGGLLPNPYHTCDCDITNIQIAKREFTEQEAQNAANGIKLDNLDLYFGIDTLTETQWIDSENDLIGVVENGIIIPKYPNAIKLVKNSLAHFNGTDNYAVLDTEINLGKVFEIKWKGIIYDKIGQILGRVAANSEGVLHNTTLNAIQLAVNFANDYFTFPYNTDEKFHEYKIVRNGLSAECFVDGVSIGTDTILEVHNTDTVIGQIAARRDTHLFWGTLDLAEINLNGQIVRFTECASNRIYFINSNNAATIYGTLSTVWITSDLVEPYNYNYGFDLWSDDSDPSNFSKYLRVPLKEDGTSIKTQGDIITGYTWIAKYLLSENKYLTPIESKLKQYYNPDAFAADENLSTNYWYTDIDTANEKSYTDVVANYLDENIVTADINADKRDLTLFFRNIYFKNSQNLLKV